MLPDQGGDFELPEEPADLEALGETAAQAAQLDSDQRLVGLRCDRRRQLRQDFAQLSGIAGFDHSGQAQRVDQSRSRRAGLVYFLGLRSDGGGARGGWQSRLMPTTNAVARRPARLKKEFLAVGRSGMTEIRPLFRRFAVDRLTKNARKVGFAKRLAQQQDADIEPAVLRESVVA